MVNCDAVPTALASLWVPTSVATMVRDRRMDRILPVFPRLFVVPSFPMGLMDRRPRRQAAAAAMDQDRVRRRISLAQLCDSQRWGEYQTTHRSLHADCRCTFPCSWL